MSNETARDRVAEAIVSSIEAPTWENDGSIAIYEDDPDAMADAAIAAHNAWLWEQADDPAVVVAVAQQIFKRPDTNVIERGETQGYITTMLAALIGPRPGQEPTDER